MNPPSKSTGFLRQLFGRKNYGTNSRDAAPQTNWVTLSISFLLAVTLWFIVALNKQDYQTWMDVPVKLVNFPERYQLLQPFPARMEVLAEGHGIDLLLNNFRKQQDTIKIDFSQYEQKGQFVSGDNLDVLTRGLPTNLKARRAKPTFINLEYNLKATKRVPVMANLDLKLPAGYRIFGEMKFKPDSVLVIGPQALLDTLTSWPTQRIQLVSETDSVTQYLALARSDPFEVLTKEVRVNFVSRPFTEAETRVPVRVINVPDNVEVELWPEFVTVKYLVPLDDYEKWQNKPFEVTVDYQRIKPGVTQQLYPVVSLPPDRTEVTLIDPVSVEYTVIRK